MRIAILGSLALATATAVSSPDVPPVQTPGSLALLLLQPFDVTTAELWAAALQDTRPEVRAAAARAINARGVGALAPNVLRALASETDPYAAEEEILAAGALGGPAAIEPILQAGQRLRDPAARSAAEILARMYGVESLRHVPALRSAGFAGFDGMLRLATKGGKEGLTSAAATALEQNDDALWAALLRGARRARASIDPSAMAQALGSTSEAIRATTYWHLVLSWASRGAKATATERSAEAALEAEPPKDLAGVVARELLARLMGRKPVEQAAWLAALGAKTFPMGRINDLAAAPAPVLAVLTPAEMKAVSVAKYDDPERLAALLKKRRPEPTSVKNAPARKEVLRTVSRFPPGFVAGVLEASGCDARSAHGVAVADIAYSADGRPLHISIFSSPDGEPALGGPPACQRAAAALFAASLAPAGHRTNPETKETLLVLLDPAPITCLAENDSLVLPRYVFDEGVGAEIPDEGGRIREPKKVTNVTPHYPKLALDGRIEGTVILEATISPTGCIVSLARVWGVDALDWEALHTVAQWRYTPTLLKGVPVPVLMTVTINFKLGQ